MSQISNIEWTEATWNFLAGCDKVSPGCKNCYAIKDAWRMAHNPNEKVSRKFLPVVKKENGNLNWTGEITFTEEALKMPLRIKKPTKFFVNSLSDLFHKNVKDVWIDRAFAVMALTPHHTYQILTKRPERMVEYLSRLGLHNTLELAADKILPGKGHPSFGGKHLLHPLPLPNVWLGVSVENQETADERIPILLQTPAAVRWLSMEPLLGPVSLRWMAAWRRSDGSKTALKSDAVIGDKSFRSTDQFDGLRELDWVVAGGESGPNSRPTHPNWIRSIRDQCQEAKVPFFFKQWGDYISGQPGDKGLPYKEPDHCWSDAGDYASFRVGKKKSGRLLDGKAHDEFPWSLATSH